MKKKFENMLSTRKRKPTMCDQDVDTLFTLADDFGLLRTKEEQQKFLNLVIKSKTYTEAHRQLIDLIDIRLCAA